MWSLTDASPERFRSSAREIHEGGQWRSFLTPQEHESFVVALTHENPETWPRFLAGKIPLKVRVAATDAEPGNADSDVDPVALAFRVRYMLWESQIDHLDGDSWLGQASSTREQQKLGNQTSGGARSGDQKPEESQSKATRDEDYDDEYDDDEDDDSAKQQTQAAEVPPLKEIVVELRHEDSEPDPKGSALALQNGSRMYDTFEQDVENSNRFNQLRESDEEIQRELDTVGSPGNALNGGSSNNMRNGDAKSGNTDVKSEPNVNSASRSITKTAQFGSANSCLKHLSTTIEQKRQSLNVTDMESRNLISDVRKNRSKWASEERVGQEELYEACERVVQDSRNTTEHSTPFSNKVSKREAPNYYDIIKEPMDLNTVMRKLRASQYGSKKEFVNDSNSIWSNCLTYNSDPAHFSRKHAIAMRNKTQASAPSIPDITIRSRAEVEAEAEIQERRRREQKRKDENPESASNDSKRRRIDGKEPKKGPRETTKEESKDETAKDETTKDETAKEEDDQPHTDNVGSVLKEIDESIVPDEAKTDNIEGSESKSAPNQEDTKTDEGKSEESRPEEAKLDDAKSDEMDVDEPKEDGEESREDTPSYVPNEEDYWTPDAESAMWNRATRRKRVECIAARKISFTDDKLQMDASVSSRNPAEMSKFDRTIRGDTEGANLSTAANTPPPFASGISLLSPESDEAPFMLEYAVNAGMPADSLGDLSSWLSAPIPRAQDLPPSQYLARGESNASITRNLNEMQSIRRIIAKIMYIRDLQSGQISQEMYAMPYAPPSAASAATSVAASSVPGSAQPNGAQTPGIAAPGSAAVSAGAGSQSAGAISAPGTASGDSAGTINGASASSLPGSAAMGGPMAGTMGQTHTSVYNNISDPEEDISSRLPGAVPFDGTAANSSMRRSVAKVFMQAGFEAANPRALDCVTAIAGDYLQKLGTTLVANLEAPDSTASFGSILSGTLQEMGVQKLGQLTKYISDDVSRQGRRLATFRSRLNTMLVDILRPEVERYQDDQFQEDSDQFVFGQFSNELGDDYFGFRDLGLDKELSIASVAVPFHLLQQRLAGQSLGTSGGTGHRKRGHEFPQYEPLTPESISQMPVLFRGAFERLAAKPSGLPYSSPLTDTALSEATHAGLAPDAHAEVVVQMCELTGKKQPDTRQAKEVAKQLAQKQSEGCTPEELEAEKRRIESDYLAKMAVQASVARQKSPANGKLTTRKKRFDNAFVLVKTEKKEKEVEENPPSAQGEDESKASEDEISDNMIDFGLNGENDVDSARGNDETNDIDVDAEPEEDQDVNEIGSLAFDDDPTVDTGFTFDDSLPTGSLMMQGNDNDEDEDEEVGDANDDLGFEFMNK